MFDVHYFHRMRLAIAFILSVVVFSLGSCKKDQLLTSADAKLTLATELLTFDTVFTTVGSITKSFTVVNVYDQPLNISNIQLMGGSSSAYSINVNGSSGTSFSNIRLNAFDSMYVFVKVNINPGSSNLPFLVKDSIRFSINGNTQQVQLQAYGQNARFISSGRISSNTTWNNTLPYVIVKPLTIDNGITLTITEGTRIYCNATAPIIVNGTLKALGKVYDSTRITFRGDRLDETYRDFPGTWPGIVFNNSSSNNELRYTNVLNAYQAVIAQGNPNDVTPKLTLFSCQISNAYDVGLLAFNTKIVAENCLISQVGNDGETGLGGSNVLLAAGGNYTFNHCTIATYANFYQNHKQPALFISNNSGTQSLPLQVQMDNCIVYGQGGLATDEIVVSKTGNTAFSIQLRNCLYKVKNDPANVSFLNSLKNVESLFDSISTSRQQYNFRLRDESPARNAGIAGGPSTDLDGLPRPAGTRPDIGCYEKQ